MAWVLDSSKSRLAARLVLLSIANHADAHGFQAWPSIPTIAREAHVSERQAQRAILELACMGELLVCLQGGPGKSNAYRVVMGGDKLSPGGVTNPTIGGDKSGGAIRKNRPEPSKPINPPTPLKKGGVITKRDIRLITKTLEKRGPCMDGSQPHERDAWVDGICRGYGVDPDVYRERMNWPRAPIPAGAQAEQETDPFKGERKCKQHRGSRLTQSGACWECYSAKYPSGCKPA